MSRLRSLLDATPLADLALALMRDAVGRPDVVEPIKPTRPAALPARRRIGFWSLIGGVGASTTAALVAHRSAAAGSPPLLVDLDRWAPSLALRARIEAATVADALVQPGREAELVSRWSSVAFLPGSPTLRGRLDIDRTADLLTRVGGAGPIVLDLGAGADALAPTLASILDRLCVVTGPRVAQLQAAFCAMPLVRDLPCATGLVVVGAADEDAKLIAGRVGMTLFGVVPADPYLAQDEFATRAPTLRAIDALIRALS